MFTRLKSFLLASALVLLIALLSKAAVTQLVLYDNFASRNIDHSKWNGWQFSILIWWRQHPGSWRRRASPPTPCAHSLLLDR